MYSKALYILSLTAYVARAAPVADTTFSAQTTASSLSTPSTSPSSVSQASSFSSALQVSSAPVASATYGAEAVFVYPSQASSSTSPLSSASASPSASEEDFAQNPLVMAYYPSWTRSQFPPESINFTNYDWMDFAFAIPTEDFDLTWDDPAVTPGLFSRFVDACHAGGARAKLSIGGWTGSKYFSRAVATNDSRQTFVHNIANLYENFDLDGIDIDWEYPAHQGYSGNEISPNDTANFLAFLRLLRDTLPDDAVITAATQPTPFVDENGRSMQNVSDFARVLDWILIMNYDVWSSSPTPGPNAPFYDACHNSTQPEASAVGAFNAWQSAGFPPEQMVLGLPSYGYLSSSNATRLRTRFFPRQDSNGTALVLDDGTAEGQIQFRSMVAQNALVPNTTTEQTTFVAGNGFTREWDDCSSTPFLHSLEFGQVVSYDDTESLTLKASFVKKVGMLGVNMWDVDGDTDQGDLVRAIRTAVGY